MLVVFHHVSLTIPAISDVYLVRGTAPAPTWTAVWWMTATPAQLLLAGPQAVLIFFVLSGFVLLLPVLNNPAFDWISYYSRRTARLYLPAIASVLFAAICLWVSDRDSVGASSDWLAAAAGVNPTWWRVLSASDLVFGDHALNNPLWSLRWEVLFSLFLPIYLVAALVTTRYRWLALAASWAVVFVGIHTRNDALALLPTFFGGSILAVKADEIRQWAMRGRNGATIELAGPILLVASLLLLSLRWMVWGVMPNASRLLTLADSLQFPSAVALVFVAAFWTPLVRLLCTRGFQWLGRVSFSLYLVHVPVIIAVGAVIGPGHAIVHLMVSLACALFVAELFFRLVEGPSHQLSRFIGVTSSRIANTRLETDIGPGPLVAVAPAGRTSSGTRR